MLGDRPLSGFIPVAHGRGYEIRRIMTVFFCTCYREATYSLGGLCLLHGNTVMPLHTNGVSGRALHSASPTKGKYVYTESHVERESERETS